MEKFLNKLNSFDPTIKFTADCSKETINFLDVNTRLVEGELMADFLLSLPIGTSFYIQDLPTLIIARKEYPTV